MPSQYSQPEVSTRFSELPDGARFSLAAGPGDQELFEQPPGWLVKAGDSLYLRQGAPGLRFFIDASEVVAYDIASQPTHQELEYRGFFATPGIRHYLSAVFALFPEDVSVAYLRDFVEPRSTLLRARDLIEFIDSGLVSVVPATATATNGKSHGVVVLGPEGIILAHLLGFRKAQKS